MEKQVGHEQLMASLRVLVSQACVSRSVESELNADTVTVKLRFGKGAFGDVGVAREVAALLAQEMC
jgi:hypothetical protein